jgi:multiple sugar transport system permease protein
MGSSIAMSFTDKLFTYSKTHFIGLQNYLHFPHDKMFWLALLHSIKLTAIGVAGVLVLGLGLALLLNNNARHIKFFRGLLFLPWVLPSMVVTLTFRWIYNDLYGYANYILTKYEIIQHPVNLLAETQYVWVGIMIPIIWCFYPFAMVYFLAALQSIDKNLYEVAQLDGATKWQMFWSITMPLLKPTLIVITILETIWIFCNFDLVYLLTRGGPGDSTLTLSLYIYKTAFEALDMGYASAISVIMFIMLLAFTILYFLVIGRNKTY